MKSLRTVVVKQFGRPSALLGRLVGLLMRVRPSNRERNLRTVALLDIRSDDKCSRSASGRGLAIERAAALASRGKVVGIDHSELMLRAARRRNAKAIEAGRVELLLGSADRLPDFASRFDKVYAVNVYMFWDDPVARGPAPSKLCPDRVPPGCPSSAEFDGMGWNRKEQSGTTS
jgi:SAM-dependent methyltransferase